jgi:alkylhydroperoxidase family enzyme
MQCHSAVEPRARHVSMERVSRRTTLAWAEAVTRAAGSPVSDAVFARAREWFTDVEIVNLTMIIAATNAWNRGELSFSSARANSPDISLD